MRKVLRGHWQQLLAAFLMGLVLALMVGLKPTNAEGYVVVTGYDISWPQCDTAYPQGDIGFGIVGVNDGRAFTHNECLASQYRWATTGVISPAVYINLSGVKKPTLTSLSGPAGTCLKRDTWCQAYNYGFKAARDSYDYAVSQGVDPGVHWWLDIETMNYWSDSKPTNARVISGAIDFFQQRGMRLGIYSTPYQWNVIAGTYAPGLPNWTAGAADLADAIERCTDKYAFGGGTVVMVQWVEQFDRNFICPE